MRLIRWLGLVVVVLALGVAAAGCGNLYEPWKGPLPDPQVREREEIVVAADAAKPIQAKISEEDMQATLEYWTQDRMDNAQPLDISLPGPRRPYKHAFKPKSPGSAEGAPPTEFLNEEDRLLNTGGRMTPHHWEYPWPYMRYQMPFSNYLTYPARAIGKLFYRKPGDPPNLQRVCSASVVTSGTGNTIRRIVWTAGHCLYTPGVGWHTNVVFRPAYRDGAAPLGTWAAVELWSLEGWTKHGSLRYDMGAIVTQRLNRQRIGNVTGMLGFAWDRPYKQEFHAIGYPQDPPFNGKRQWICTAGQATTDSPGAISGPGTVGIGCDQTGGTSGGPWVTQLNEQPPISDATYMGCGSKCYVNGVNSYRGSLDLFSPYCGTDNGCYGLWDTVRNRDP